MPPRHQAHLVANRNKRLRLVRAGPSPPVRTCDGLLLPDPTNGRLKVVPRRDFEFNVPFTMSEGSHTLRTVDETANPINQLGAVVSGNVPVVTCNDFDSFLAAFNKRSNFKQAGPEDDIDETSFKEACALIDGLPDLFDDWDDNDHDRERWLSKFAPDKQLRMREGYQNIPGASASYIGTKDLSVKQEVLLKRYDTEWAPRLIYAGNDVFNAVTGPACMVVMERLVQLLNHSPVGPVEFKAAYKTDDVALCRFLSDPKYTQSIEGDFSRNDREQRRKVAHLYDHWLAKLRLPNWFRFLLLKIESYKVQNKRYGFTSWLDYQLPTGTTSTTPRNTTYNITMFAVTCCRQRVRGKAVVLGDDLLATLNKRLCLDAWVATVASFKMVLKPKVAPLDGEATFLSRRLIFDVEEPCMVPLLGKMLVRFNVRGTNNDAITDSAYMAGKALSYAYECRHVPLLRDIFMARYAMEDSALVSLDDLTWFARSSGVHTVQDVEQRIRDERVTISDDTFSWWTLTHYDLDLVEIRDMFELVVLDPSMTVLDLPLIEKMRKDLG
jgi:hypothetical protein